MIAEPVPAYISRTVSDRDSGLGCIIAIPVCHEVGMERESARFLATTSAEFLGSFLETSLSHRVARHARVVMASADASV